MCNSFGRLVPSQAIASDGHGAQQKETPGAAELVEGGEFQAVFTGKKMFELDLEGSVGVHQGERGRAFRIEGTA